MESGAKGPYVMLFVPAADERKRTKAMTLAADAVILDLEDAIPDGMKTETRAALRAWLDGGAEEAPGAAGSRPEIWVRTNGPLTPWFAEDIRLAAHPRVDGIVLPMAETPEHVRAAKEALAEGDGRREEPGQLVLLVETARGLLGFQEMAAEAPPGTRVAFGTLDFALELGVPLLRPNDTDLIWDARARVVLEAKAAGMPPPIDGVYPDLEDDEGLRRECRRVLELGFGGKLTVHPRQVEIVKEALRPDARELELARRCLAAYEEAAAEGRGAIRVGDLMVDRPVAEQARKILSVWG